MPALICCGKVAVGASRTFPGASQEPSGQNRGSAPVEEGEERDLALPEARLPLLYLGWSQCCEGEAVWVTLGGKTAGLQLGESRPLILQILSWREDLPVSAAASPGNFDLPPASMVPGRFCWGAEESQRGLVCLWWHLQCSSEAKRMGKPKCFCRGQGGRCAML